MFASLTPEQSDCIAAQKRMKYHGLPTTNFMMRYVMHEVGLELLNGEDNPRIYDPTHHVCLRN